MRNKPRSDKLRKRTARRARVSRSLARVDRPRLTVFRSARHIYAQLVDARTGRTITTISSRKKGVMGDVSATGGMEAARRVGRAVAEAALERKIDRVVFHRNGFLYHGRVKALADAAREAGLQF